jgi:hypothetical protein
MKKYLFITLFSIAAIWIIFSCRKAIDPEPKENPLMTTASLTEQKIMNFLDRIDQPLKDEKLYSTDSAIWYSEAALNFTYAIYDSSFVYLTIDTNEFSFDLDQNNKVTQPELEEVYGEMVDALDEFHDGLQDNIKHVFFCDVVEVDVSQGQLNVLMIAQFGCGYTGIIWSYFYETDYWYSVWNWGKCNGYTNDGDAGIRLTESFLTAMTVSDPDRRIWFSDDITIYSVNPYYYPYEQVPYEHRGFYNSGSGEFIPQCLAPDTLEFYRGEDGIQYIIGQENPDPQNGLEFESIIVWGDATVWGENYVELHFMDITYGIKHETTVPASPL